ncbi:hypothetical protein AHF37_10670 [Paragonimus kellicotti]|nr:hypothetical protein AHF37_10670 [Paragonimus kellicotti]
MRSIQLVPVTFSERKTSCDTSQGTPPSVVPTSFRCTVFHTLHNLSHSGIRASIKLVTERFVWPEINHHVRSWSRSCLHCQRHAKCPIDTCSLSGARLHPVQFDLVSILPLSYGSSYLLTCINRLT